MSLYFSLQLFNLKEQEMQIDAETAEILVGVNEAEENTEPPVPFREIYVYLDNGAVEIKSEDKELIHNFDVSLDEQLSNEFLVQAERMSIRSWNPMFYSSAYSESVRCSWVLDYNGLKGDHVMKSGVDTYPKKWQMLLDLIDAFDDRKMVRQESVHMAADHVATAFADNEESTEFSKAVDIVRSLSLMGMPQDVIAAGMLHSVQNGFDDKEAEQKYVRANFSSIVTDLLGEFGDDSSLDPAEKRLALLEKVRASDSFYFKGLVLAEMLSDLTAVKVKIDCGGEFEDPVMEKDEMGIYCAEMISALEVLGEDNRTSRMYGKLVDMYKSMFVTYALDSVNGVIYQTQGNAAGVCLRRGEYEWHAIMGAMPDNAEQISKSLALSLADLWKREADEILVKDGNKEGAYDVPDLTVLQVVMDKAKTALDRKDNKIVLSVLQRMVSEGEQIFTPMRAADPDMELIERGDVGDVKAVAVSFLGLEDDEGKTMAAVFTSIDELGEIDADDVEAIPVKMVLEFVKSMSRLDGIIIDPFSGRCTVSKEMIASVLEDAQKDQTKVI